MEYCKLQICCLLIVLYIAFIYYKECRSYKMERRFCVFDGIMSLSIVCIILDGATAYSVNHLGTVDPLVNMLLHMFFLVSIDSVIYGLFVYMLALTEGMPDKTWKQILFSCPFMVNVIIVVLHIDSLEYHVGEVSNYSMGVAAYTCFTTVGVYLAFSMVVFFRSWNYLEINKRINIFTYMFVMLCVTAYQVVNPEALITSMGTTVLLLGVYLNQENPAMQKLSQYHNQMVTGFSTLVENRDGNTGNHIKRTTMYVTLLCAELRKQGYYRRELTKDYMKNLIMAAPMHDIGKISIPDNILLKPGKLTFEEFEIMKTHSANGGKIIQETFGHMENEQYGQLAFQVAHYHHEKWNGKGYPEGLSGNDIPLGARIMAVADVFDAVSEKRCYRDAMPLEQCFDIIRSGKGTDFDPILVEVFLSIEKKVEQVHRNHVIENESRG